MYRMTSKIKIISGEEVKTCTIPCDQSSWQYPQSMLTYLWPTLSTKKKELTNSHTFNFTSYMPSRTCRRLIL